MARLWLLSLALLTSACLAAEDVSVFPGREWQRVNAKEAGFSEKKLDALRAWLKTQKTTGLVVVSGGRVVLEHGDVAHVSKVASVRKSILAMLYGATSRAATSTSSARSSRSGSRISRRFCRSSARRRCVTC